MNAIKRKREKNLHQQTDGKPKRSKVMRCVVFHGTRSLCVRMHKKTKKKNQQQKQLLKEHEGSRVLKT